MSEMSVKALHDLFGGTIPTTQVLQGVASGMADCDVKVVIHPSIHVPQADPAKKTIYLPAYVKSARALLIVSWYVDHESGHIIFTSPFKPILKRWLRNSKMNDICVERGYGGIPDQILEAGKGLLNMAEDARIERLMVGRFPGSKKHFIGGPIAVGCHTMVEDTVAEAWEKAKAEGKDKPSLNPFWVAEFHASLLLGGTHGQNPRNHVRDTVPEHVHWVCDIVDDDFGDIDDVTLVSTHDLSERADSTMAKILEKILPDQTKKEESEVDSDGSEKEDSEKCESSGSGGGFSPFDDLEDLEDRESAPKESKYEDLRKEEEDERDDDGGDSEGDDRSDGDRESEEGDGESDSGESESESGGDESGADDDSGSGGEEGADDSSDDGAEGTSGEGDEPGSDSSDSGAGSGSDGTDSGGDPPDDPGAGEGHGTGDEDTGRGVTDGADAGPESGSERDGSESDSDDSEGEADDGVDGEAKGGLNPDDSEAAPEERDVESAMAKEFEQVLEWAEGAKVDMSEIIRESDAFSAGREPDGSETGSGGGHSMGASPTSIEHATDSEGMPHQYLENLFTGAGSLVISGMDLEAIFSEDDPLFHHYDILTRKLMPTTLGPAARKLVGKFKGAPGIAYTGNRINPRMIQPIMAGRAHGRKLMLKRTEPIQSKRGVCVALVVDCSGSMRCGIGGLEFAPENRDWQTRFTVAHAAARSMARLFQTVGVPFAVYGFTTTDSGAGYHHSASRAGDIVNFVFKNYEDPWNVSEQQMLAMNQNTNVRYKGRTIAAQANADGESILWVASDLIKRQEDRKILIVLSDGQPEAGGNNRLQSKFLRWTVRRIEMSGIRIGGFGLGDRGVSHYYKHHEMIPSFPPGFGTEATAPLLIQEKILKLVDQLSN